jgi:hypothetical protein
MCWTRKLEIIRLRTAVTYSPNIAPRRRKKGDYILFGTMNSINSRWDALRPSMRLSRRWLGLERRARIAHQAPRLYSCQATWRIECLHVIEETPRISLVQTTNRNETIPALAVSRTPALRLHSRKIGVGVADSDPSFHRSRHGAQLHESCAIIRVPGRNIRDRK